MASQASATRLCEYSPANLGTQASTFGGKINLNLFLAVLIFLPTIVFSVPAKDNVKLHGHHVHDILHSCKKTLVKEDFNASTKYGNSPTNGPFHYERHGILYYNLAPVTLSKVLVEFKLGRKGREKIFKPAAICVVVLPNGRCLQAPMAAFAIQPRSKVHAFKVKRLSFFCMKGKKPTPCEMEFFYSEKGNGTSEEMNWQPLKTVPGGQSLAFADIGGWIPTEAELVFSKLPLLQAFAIRLRQMDPVAVDKSSKAANGHGHKMRTKAHNVTAYIEYIEFATWECRLPLSEHPFGGFTGTLEKREGLF